MLSRHTKNIFAGFLKNGNAYKSFILPSGSYQTAPPVSGYNLFHFGQNRKWFSNSNDDNNDNNKNSDAEETTDENDQSKNEENTKEAKNAKKTASSKKKAKTVDAGSSFEKVEMKRLKSVPLRPTKLPLDKEDEKAKVESFVVFSSTTPVVPFCQIPGQVQTGSLVASNISNKLAFFTQNEIGEIYTVGLILENTVSKSLKKSVPQQSNFSIDRKQYPAPISTKKQNYRVKIVEIEFKDNCIYAHCIPYKDSKPTPEEKLINIQSVLTQIKNTVLSIRQLVSHEKIDAFHNISFDQIYSKKFDSQSCDILLYQIANEFFKLAAYTKDNLQQFIQALLEERSLVSRMFMVKKKLEETKATQEIVNKSIHHADEQIWRFHEQSKARLSIEYIKSNYIQNDPNQASKIGGGAGGNSQVDPAKKFMDQLNLIKDEISKDRVRKEIEKLSMQDKSASEFSKIYGYLEEVFSLPWEKYTKEYWNTEYTKEVLNKRLFGLEKVKDRILELVAVNKLRRTSGNTDAKSKKGFVILLNGPPGTGKTKIARAIAESLKREHRFVSFSGVNDPTHIKGHKRTYVDSQPGIFIKELIKAKTMNPVFVLDEIDKINRSSSGADPYYALMEILNPEENKNFTDHFLDIRVDFSQVIFILTSNEKLNMLEPLRNRLEIIDVPSYVEQEKLCIAKDYLLPEIFEEHHLKEGDIVFDDQTLSRIIKGWCYYESGVRNLRRCLEKISRKYVSNLMEKFAQAYPELVEEKKILEEKDATEENAAESNTDKPFSGPVETEINQQINNKPITIDSQKIDFGINNHTPALNEDNAAKETPKTENEEEDKEDLELLKQNEEHLMELKSQNPLHFDSNDKDNDTKLKKYLGQPLFDEIYKRMKIKPKPGSVNILSVAGFTGSVLTIECIFDLTKPEQKGLVTYSGNLQKVLEESLTIAKLNAFRFLSEEQAKTMASKNIHVHFLDGSSPKDGPSAGLSITTAFISLALNKPVPKNISMTGELSLNGEVCKIGGVQAKVTASKTLGIDKIILPWGNKEDFYELPQLLKDDLTVYFVNDYQEVYDIVFGNNPTGLRGIEKYQDGQFFEAIQPSNADPGSHASH